MFKTILLLLLILSFSIISQAGKKRPAELDFDGDGVSDPTVGFYQNNYQLIWFSLLSSGGYSGVPWGASDGQNFEFMDLKVPGDYDGDGKTDIAVWRRKILQEGQSYFYILYSATGTYQIIPWGLKDDQPMVQDYDGDGKADIALVRWLNVSGNIWYIMQSRDGLRIERFGTGDVWARGDYDGDGKADLVSIRRSGFEANYTWFIKRSSDGNWIVEQFGNEMRDIVVPGDYDGDGKNDIAVWRGRSEGGNGIWYWHRSSDGAYEQIKWGTVNTPDYPAQADYDGDGKTDIAIWRQGGGSCDGNAGQSYFYINGTSSGIQIIPWGNGCMGPITP